MGADSLAENTNFSPIRMPKPKSFWKKKLCLGVRSPWCNSWTSPCTESRQICSWLRPGIQYLTLYQILFGTLKITTTIEALTWTWYLLKHGENLLCPEVEKSILHPILWKTSKGKPHLHWRHETRAEIIEARQKACRSWGCRGCHDTPRFWQISEPYLNQK